MFHKNYGALLVRVGISFFLIWAIAHKLDLKLLTIDFSMIDLSWFSISIVLIFFQIVMGAIRWQAILIGLGSDVDVWRTFKVYYASIFFVTFTPTGILGDIVRVWHAQRFGLSITSAFSSVLLDRIMVFGYLMLIVLITACFLPMQLQSLFPPNLFLTISIFSCVAGIGLLIILSRLPVHMKANKFIVKIYDLIDSYLVIFSKPFSIFSVLILTVLSQVLLCAAITALAMSTKIGLSPFQLMMLMPLVILAMMMPISIGGWGVRESAMVITLGAMGVNAEKAFFLAVLLGVMTLITSLPGCIMWLLIRSNDRDIKNN